MFGGDRAVLGTSVGGGNSVSGPSTLYLINPGKKITPLKKKATNWRYLRLKTLVKWKDKGKIEKKTIIDPMYHLQLQWNVLGMDQFV